jgi:hypothetical protein
MRRFPEECLRREMKTSDGVYSRRLPKSPRLRLPSPGGRNYFDGANSEYSVWTIPTTHSSLMIPVQETFLDPYFWQALGRALEWEKPCYVCIACSQGAECTVCCGYYWMYQWHCFIQCLAEGKTAESFFETLSTPPTSHDVKHPQRESD